MGRNAAAELEKKHAILRDALLAQYLQQVGHQVAQASHRPQLQYHFQAVDSPVINAFSLPGGYVYVNRGLIEFVETESELAGVLAHEVGHIVAYHSMNDVARRWLVDRLVYEGKKAGLLDDHQIQDVLQRYGGPVLLFLDRKFSREEEYEADLLALYNARRAGWDAKGLTTFLDRLSHFAGSPDLTEFLLRRHPLPSDRVDLLRAELKEHLSARGLIKDSVSFRTAKGRVKSLPPSPRPQRE